MKISEQIKALCTASDISIAELARRVGHSPQGFNGKLKRESFKIEELAQLLKLLMGNSNENLFYQMVKRYDEQKKDNGI